MQSYSAKGCVRSLLSGLVPAARRNHRLALCLTATYGRTLSKASEDLMQVKNRREGEAAEEQVKKRRKCG